MRFLIKILFGELISIGCILFITSLNSFFVSNPNLIALVQFILFSTTGFIICTIYAAQSAHGTHIVID